MTLSLTPLRNCRKDRHLALRKRAGTRGNLLNGGAAHLQRRSIHATCHPAAARNSLLNQAAFRQFGNYLPV